MQTKYSQYVLSRHRIRMYVLLGTRFLSSDPVYCTHQEKYSIHFRD